MSERLAVELSTIEAVNPAAVKYLNRLSDWFFCAARMANNGGKDRRSVGSGRKPLKAAGCPGDRPATGRAEPRALRLGANR